MERIYLAMGPFVWGKGKTEAEALRQIRREWFSGRFSKERCVMYKVHPDTEVTGLGDFRHPIGCRPERVWTGKLVK